MEINQKHLTDPEGAAKMNSFLGFFIRDLLSILRSVKNLTVKLLNTIV